MEDYNFLLLDGAVIQMIYEFDHRDNIVGHILSFYLFAGGKTPPVREGMKARR